MFLTYVWSSPDHAEGRRNLDTILSLNPVVMNTVSEMSPAAWSKVLGASVASQVWGSDKAVSFSNLSPKVLKIVGEALETMPSDPGTGLSIHMLSAQSPSVTDKALMNGSCFGPEARQGHFMVELLGQAIDPANVEECQRWMGGLHDALRASGEAMKGTYVSLIKPGDVGLDDIYGEKWELLQNLKKKFDPEGFFRYAVPVLG